MTQALSKVDYEALAAFRHALRRFLDFSGEAAKEAGLTPQQHQALLAIKGFPDRDRVTIGELAEQLVQRHHSTVGLVDRLEALGLVRREADPADRRRALVALTDRAEAVLAGLSAIHRAELRRLGPSLAALLQRLEGRDEG
ncbi:MarR family winged helix-turn-helix transcriptional regulator [Mycobacterium sp. KBS0706]|uniref:MarR family winged helix-turn-helix transcriptional regulator n=1 Tax=Mycobacterium sp. KBS0706 TaxID=2578109 RepID=UPI00163D47D2|nr:MarR family transcriptional regulator [Mycobacterium sp. KBS0706]